MLTKSNNDDITCQIEDVVDDKIARLDILTNEYLESRIAEITEGSGTFDPAILDDYAKKTHTHTSINNNLTLKGTLELNTTEPYKANFFGGENKYTRVRIGNATDDSAIYGYGSISSKEKFAYINVVGSSAELQVHPDKVKVIGPITVSGVLTTNDNLSVNGRAVVNELLVDGTATIVNNLIVEKQSTIGEGLSVNGSAIIGNGLTVYGQITTNENVETTGLYMKINGDTNQRGYRMYFNANRKLLLYDRDNQKDIILWSGSQTITHKTNVIGLTHENITSPAEIGTFCETNGGIYDGYEEIAETDCICQVVQSTTLNSKIVGIITSNDQFASHGDCLVKVVPGTYKLGDILVPDITGYARVATETELQFMMLHAIPRPKITSLEPMASALKASPTDTKYANMVSCFII